METSVPRKNNNDCRKHWAAFVKRVAQAKESGRMQPSILDEMVPGVEELITLARTTKTYKTESEKLAKKN